MVLDPVNNTGEYGISAISPENRAGLPDLLFLRDDCQWYMISSLYQSIRYQRYVSLRYRSPSLEDSQSRTKHMVSAL
jgi:hypothetical protein